jgi:hypothetical protein
MTGATTATGMTTMTGATGMTGTTGMTAKTGVTGVDLPRASCRASRPRARRSTRSASLAYATVHDGGARGPSM